MTIAIRSPAGASLSRSFAVHRSGIRFTLGRALGAFSSLALVLVPAAALANNVGENTAWQFETTADKANKAFIEDMRQKRQSGYYAAPVYNTYIDRQYNCSVSSLAAGNQSTSTAIGNSPSTTGNSASSVGNSDTSQLTPGYGTAASSITGTQGNSGSVESEVSGNISSSVRGDTSQALNNTQDNTGAQTASVTSSNACQFGPLN